MRLHVRLALVSSLLLGAAAIALGFWITRIAERYQAEVAQRLNASIAMYVTRELTLLGSSGINDAALKELANRVMTVNPSAEVYLLDRHGTIIATLIPADLVVRKRVDLQPVERFLAGSYAAPLYGDDPTKQDRRAVFSVSPVSVDNARVGYLYVVLGGQRFDTIVDAVRGNYSLKVGLIVVLALLLVTLAIAASLFTLLTLPLRRLARRIEQWSDRMGIVSAPVDPRNDDEIGALNRQFETMASRIEEQVAQIKLRDPQRRELIAGISHDLRTPLATLHGYLETVVLKGEQLPATARRQYLETALRHSQQLERLIGTLFELSKLEAGTATIPMERFSLAELVQDIALPFRLRAQQLGIQLQTVVDPEAPLARGDVSLIERVFENLLDNALRNTPAGGSVSLEMHCAPHHLRARVIDTGRGIQSDELPYVFDRHYQGANRSRDGGGLGLAIVRRIVELHGGEISIQSKPDAGTKVEFTLPYEKSPGDVQTQTAVA